MSEHDNQKFIDGIWYEEQYGTEGSRYSNIYNKPIPAWARDANDFHARFVQAFFLLDKFATVLDLGSGTGRQLDAWASTGDFLLRGVEISKEAVKRSSWAHRIKNRSAADLSCFKDGQFYLAHSNAFFEHVAPEITTQVLRESMRVARYGAHWIPMEKGDDPSHIHIQSREAWIEEILAALGKGFVVGCAENPVDDTQPLFVITREGDEPWPVTRVPTFKLG